MKQCPRCSREFEEKSGVYIKTYCSRKCANVRVQTDHSKQKKADAMAKYYASLSGEELTIRQEQWMETGSKTRATRLQQLLAADLQELGYGAIRKRILIEQAYKCNRCSLTTWLGEKISLELEHKDGNPKNNTRSNLECLCPNCHALTPTWRGKDRKKTMAA